MTTSTTDLADRYLAFRKHTEQERALWSGDLTHLERWDDVTPQGVELRTSTLAEMADRADERIADSDRVLLETIAFGARAEIADTRWRHELRWVNPAIGLVPILLTFLPRFRLRTAEDGGRYLEKLAAFRRLADDWIATLDRAAAHGIVPIRSHVDEVVAMIDRLLDGQIAGSSLGRQEPPVELSPSDAAAWREQMLLLLDAHVAPGLHRVARTLRSATLPVAREDDRPGLCHLPEGEEIYHRLVWASTSLDVTPERVHGIGLEQVQRLEDEYRTIGRSVLGTDDVASIFRLLREDPELHYSDARTLVADASAALDRATEAAGGWFTRLPSSPCTAEPIEQGPLAYYSRPLADGSKDGAFFFNTSDPSMWGTYQLEAVTFHEGVPGHHLQVALAVENDDLHDVHREFSLSAFSEGWALYTERLADEMGLYSSDLDRLGMLSADSMRACRLVVDTGLHALGWTRDRAIEYMFDNTPMARSQIVGEIDRYIGFPGQATSYMIGRLEIDRLRAEATRRTDFDLAQFHDTTLSHGSIPLPTLRTLVLGD